jgi:hypothetical protein
MAELNSERSTIIDVAVLFRQFFLLFASFVIIYRQDMSLTIRLAWG